MCGWDCRSGAAEAGQQWGAQKQKSVVLAGEGLLCLQCFQGLNSHRADLCSRSTQSGCNPRTGQLHSARTME